MHFAGTINTLRIWLVTCAFGGLWQSGSSCQSRFLGTSHDHIGRKDCADRATIAATRRGPALPQGAALRAGRRASAERTRLRRAGQGRSRGRIAAAAAAAGTLPRMDNAAARGLRAGGHCLFGGARRLKRTLSPEGGCRGHDGGALGGFRGRFFPQRVVAQDARDQRGMHGVSGAVGYHPS